MNNSKKVLLLVLSALTVVFILQNITDVEIEFLFWSLRMSRALMVIFLIAIGVVIGWALSSSESRRKKKDDKKV